MAIFRIFTNEYTKKALKRDITVKRGSGARIPRRFSWTAAVFRAGRPWGGHPAADDNGV
jgi:hypothetical protein